MQLIILLAPIHSRPSRSKSWNPAALARSKTLRRLDLHFFFAFTYFILPELYNETLIIRGFKTLSPATADSIAILEAWHRPPLTPK